MLKVKTLEVGPLQTNCYLIYDPECQEGLIIDPGADKPRILKTIEKSGIRFKAVINTHGHFDHVGADIIKEILGIPLYLHQADLPLLKNARVDQALLLGVDTGEKIPAPDGFLKEGQELAVGGSRLVVWHTPGHSPGGICLLSGGFVLVGDTLFNDGVGRTDLEGGSGFDLERSLRRLLNLPPETIVYPGHGPLTTIGAERRLLVDPGAKQPTV